jgi:probable rRNA maturation factor
MTIEVNNESGAQADETALAGLARFVLDELGINQRAEVSLLLLESESMAALHQQWMSLEGPTDVMAFPMDGADAADDVPDPAARPTDGADAAALLGDVVLCPAVADEQAASAGHSPAAELALLCTHGVLHLLGYDHGDDETEREMFELQERLLTAWAKRSGCGPIRTPLPGTGGEKRR